MTVDADGAAARADGRGPTAIRPIDLPDPPPIVPADELHVRMSGIGGTGVITVSQILGTAAMLDGLRARARPDRPVAEGRPGRERPPDRPTASAGVEPRQRAGVDCMLGFDLLVAASDTHRAGADAGRTVVIGSLTALPTGSMVTHPDTVPDARRLTGPPRRGLAAEHNRYVDAAAITERALRQRHDRQRVAARRRRAAGRIAVDPGEHRAGDRAQRRRRRTATSPPSAGADTGWSTRRGRAGGRHRRPAAPETLDELIDRLTADLIDYQSAKLRQAASATWSTASARPRSASSRRSTELTEAVARNLHKLMAYKDEYEVARLLLLPESRAGTRPSAGRTPRSPGACTRRCCARSGSSKKIKFGPQSQPIFAALKRGKRLRGTNADPFRFAEVRRLERAMIPEFEPALDQLIAGLTAENHAEAVAIASLPDQVRGYEHLKARRAEAYRAELAERLAVPLTPDDRAARRTRRPAAVSRCVRSDFRGGTSTTEGSPQPSATGG